jgi:hypothetical protein
MNLFPQTAVRQKLIDGLGQVSLIVICYTYMDLSVLTECLERLFSNLSLSSM